MTWDVGDLVPVQTTLKVAGVLTNATMALTVTSPSTIVTTPAVTNASTGVYTANVPATEAGDWAVVWSASGAATAVQPSQFSVAALGLRLISLDEAKKHLNNTATTTDDEEIRDLIDTVTAMVELEVGPVIPQTVTDIVDVFGSTLILPRYPVLSVTSVAATQTNFTAPVLADMTTDLTTGTMFYTAAGNLPTGKVTVAYRVGRQPIPPAIRGAAKIILAHMWSTQRNRGGARAAFNAEDLSGGVPGAGFAMPNRAKELLAPYMLAPAVA